MRPGRRPSILLFHVTLFCAVLQEWRAQSARTSANFASFPPMVIETRFVVELSPARSICVSGESPGVSWTWPPLVTGSTLSVVAPLQAQKAHATSPADLTF